MSEQTPLEIVIAGRDRILATMDVEAAKRFVAGDGGTLPKSTINLYVLHSARWEVTSLPEPLKIESRIWLARNTGRSLMMLSPRSRYFRAAMDLIFPKALADAFIAASASPQQ